MANWLVFRPDDNGHFPTRTGELFVCDTNPADAGAVPGDSMVLAWVPEGCVKPSHYLRMNTRLVHSADDCSPD